MVDLLLRHGADPFARMPNPRVVAAAPEEAASDERDELSVFEMLLSRNPKAAGVFLDHFVGSSSSSGGGADDLDTGDLLIVFDFSPFESEARLNNDSCRHRKEVRVDADTGMEKEEEVEWCSRANDEMIVHAKMVFLRSICASWLAGNHGGFFLPSPPLPVCRLRELLKHPLAETYLHLKWNRTKKFFFLNIFFYSLFTVFLTGLSIFSTYIVKNCGELSQGGKKHDDAVSFPEEAVQDGNDGEQLSNEADNILLT